MVEVHVNMAAAGDPKAFAMVVQFMDKFEVFKRQTLDHSALADSALEHLHRRLVGLAGRVCTENLNPNIVVMKPAEDRV